MEEEEEDIFYIKTFITYLAYSVIIDNSNYQFYYTAVDIFALKREIYRNNISCQAG